MTSAADSHPGVEAKRSDGPAVSLFCMPKPFEGHIGVIQRNAIRSWALLCPRPQVVLVGDETGTAEMADEIGAARAPEIRCNEFGTPLIDDVFRQATRMATGQVLAYVNADIVLLGDFPVAVHRIVAAGYRQFLAIGRRIDVDVTQPIDFRSGDWQQQLRDTAMRRGKLAPRVCKDYFIFPRCMYEDMPAFAIGRGNWDNWVVYRAHRMRVPVIEATRGLTAIHQNHGYAHLSGSRARAYLTGPEAKRNQELAGGQHLVRGSASGWKLTPHGVRRKLIPFPLVQFACDLPRFSLLLAEFVGLKTGKQG